MRFYFPEQHDAQGDSRVAAPRPHIKSHIPFVLAEVNRDVRMAFHLVQSTDATAQNRHKADGFGTWKAIRVGIGLAV